MIPNITHLQFLVLASLMDGELSGQELRAELAKHGEAKTLAAFYQLMARLEELKIVKGRYEQVVIGDQRVKERRYEIVAAGRRAVDKAVEFYVSSGAAIGNKTPRPAFRF
jgi:DNA-binding PadR family transcriptional regulator